MTTHQAEWINGVKQNQLDINDRAIHYGDGFFTTIAVFNKQILNWQAHCQRINRSFQQLQITPIALSQIQFWLQQALEDYFSNGLSSHAVAKIIISRGTGGIGYQMPSIQKPNCLIVVKAAPKDLMQPTPTINAMVCQTQASIQQFSAIKHLNRLENVMARSELLEPANDREAVSEGIMLNAFDEVVCGTQSNLFFYRQGQWLTPKIERSGVLGTTRQSLLEMMADESLPVSETEVSFADILQAEELIFCNAIRGVQLVGKLFSGQQTIAYGTENATALQKLWLNWQTRHATDFA